MTEAQKRRIGELRAEGHGYSTIAAALGLTKSQVSGYCRRHGLAGPRATTHPDAVPAPDTCRMCGEAIEQVPGRKRRIFCSDTCRQAWWNSHPERVKRRAVYEFECAGCGKRFEVYGNSHRKYCNHACYIAHRYGCGNGIDSAE